MAFPIHVYICIASMSKEDYQFSNNCVVPTTVANIRIGSPVSCEIGSTRRSDNVDGQDWGGVLCSHEFL